MTWLILAWRWIAGSKIGQYAAGALAIVAVILGFRAKWRAEGAEDAERKAKDADQLRADDIRRRARDADGVPDDDKRGFRD